MSLLNSIFGEDNPARSSKHHLFEETKNFPSSRTKRSFDPDDGTPVDDNSPAKKKKLKQQKKDPLPADKEDASDSDSSSNNKSEDSDSDSSDSSSSSSSEAENDLKPQDSSVETPPEAVKEPPATTKKRSPVDKEAKPAADQSANNENETKSLSNNDNNNDYRTIFVGNLPNNFTRKQLEQLFRPCGPIESSRIRSVATTGVKLPPKSAGNQKLVKKVSANTQKVDADAKPSVVGYVVFKQASSSSSSSSSSMVDECIQKALEMNNTPVKDTSTGTYRRIRVDHSKTEYDSSRSVFVGNLPYKTDEETLRHHFCQGCSVSDEQVEGVRVVRDKETYQCKGFAYILFADKTLVATALRLMHGSEYMGQTLRVLVCTKRYNSVKGEARPKKKKTKGAMAMVDSKGDPVKPAVAALRRILEKEGDGTNARLGHHKRARGKKSGHGGSNNHKAAKAGVSRRAAAEAKANKRVKKLQKRITKGMGKSKNS